MPRLMITLILAGFSFACDKKSKDKETQLAASDQFPEIDFGALKLGDFCAQVKVLAIRDEGLREDIKRLCEDVTPTALFEKVIRESYRGQGPMNRYALLETSEGERERSVFFAVFAQKIPKLTAMDIRKSELNKILQKEIHVDVFHRTVELVSETKLDGLNFERLVFRYKTLVNGPQSTEFRNERMTEINSFQVSVQREDLGLSTEHLLETNQHYDVARTTNIIVGDPKEGGSFLISLVHFRTWNQGFPKLNVRALDTLTKANAQNVYDYLVGESQKQ